MKCGCVKSAINIVLCGVLDGALLKAEASFITAEVVHVCMVSKAWHIFLACGAGKQ